jgi:hypothetical protein
MTAMKPHRLFGSISEEDTWSLRVAEGRRPAIQACDFCRLALRLLAPRISVLADFCNAANAPLFALFKLD